MDKDFKTELTTWPKWVFNNMPIQGLDVSVLCTWVEAFSVPFKFNVNKVVTYSHPLKNLYIRKEYWEDATLLSEQGIVENRYEAIGKFPEKFVMDTANNFVNIASRYKTYLGINDRLPIGRCTGQYYIDLYGYCWFEIENNFLNSYTKKRWIQPQHRDVTFSWVRETAVNYEGKDNLQSDIETNRALVMQMRTGNTNKPKAGKALGFLSILSLLLSR